MSSTTTRKIGILMLLGAVGVLVPYTMLTINFDYPNILRQDTAVILTRFRQGGPSLIWTWLAFALTGLPLVPAYILTGQSLEQKSRLVRTATTLGVTGLVVQIVGLLRWTFVVPVLADTFHNATDPATRAAAVVAFKVVHQFGGVLLGEHLGQLLTITWTILMSLVFLRLRLLPKWMGLLGLLSSGIYLLAQAELLQTVMPGIPVWSAAGFIGSTLWLVWLIIIGIRFLTRKVAVS